MRMTLLAAFAIALCGCTHTQVRKFDASQRDLRTFILQPSPEWSADSLEQGYYLDIDRVMEFEKLSRFEAIELQNRMRDGLENPAISIEEAYLKGLAEVRAHVYESGWKPVEFANPGDFVLALDLDETLLQQWYADGAGFHDFTIPVDEVTRPDGKIVSGPYIKLTPGVEEFIAKVRKNPRCRGIVFFSAKADGPSLRIAESWKFKDGRTAREHIDGIFTRNHLYLGHKAPLPSKDLRILDPGLKHVLLIDDNPGRVFQPQALRAWPKFDASVYRKSRGAAKDGGDATIARYYESLFRLAAEEIEETARAAEREKIPFNQAYLPYSYSGERVYRQFLRQTGSPEKARHLTRIHPELQEAAFVTIKVPAAKP